MAGDLSLPRILCLHGGGVNAQVFELQCRSILARLKSNFRFVFINGPFPCPAHPAIVAVYGDMGPFYRWVPWLDEHEPIEDSLAATLITERILGSMRRDPGTGPWVGVLGFSQGAKMAASLLWAQERVRELHLGDPKTNFRFGVLLAGAGPIIHLDSRVPQTRHVEGAGQMALEFTDWPADSNGDHAIRTETLHVHGLRDSGLEWHRRLFSKYCKGGSTRLMEWDGDHRVPIKTAEVAAIVKDILDMAEGVDGMT
ncbi:serine hydrolase FSH [Stachybotrys elegans]|uniref:Serine hydrolase FSH n=1 Tax=Stachybotrys elegans TaxID=80388 RepID=A0A8K0WSA5_9HYPO|nr:serine hydrolase FSH [Stachybotrys elegans]